MPKRTKAERKARRKEVGRKILSGLKAGDKFLRKTKVISKTGKAIAPLAGQYSPYLMVGSAAADAVGYGRRKTVRKGKRGMKF